MRDFSGQRFSQQAALKVSCRLSISAEERRDGRCFLRVVRMDHVDQIESIRLGIEKGRLQADAFNLQPGKDFIGTTV